MNVACRFKFKLLPTAIGVLLLAGGLVLLWFSPVIRQTDGSAATGAQSAGGTVRSVAISPRAGDTAPEAVRVAVRSPSQSRSGGGSSGPVRSGTEFDIPRIYEALQQIRRDPQGNIIPDHRALTAMNEILNYGRVPLAERDLQELRELIRIALPGDAGNQVAELTSRYHRFLQAEQEFTELHRVTGFEQPPQALYDELVALRQLYLGDDLVTSLFAQVDEDSRYLLKSMELERDQTLPTKERRRRQTRLSEQHHNSIPDIADWEQRLAIYESEENLILASPLSEEEKQQQVDALLERHFSANEIPAVKKFLDSR